MLLELISQQATNKYGFTYNHSFMTVIPSNCCKETSIGLLHTEKIAEVVLLYVFKITFSASLFGCLDVNDHNELGAILVIPTDSCSVYNLISVPHS